MMANHKTIQIQCLIRNMDPSKTLSYQALFLKKKERKKERRHLPLVSSANRGYTVSPHDLKAHGLEGHGWDGRGSDRGEGIGSDTSQTPTRPRAPGGTNKCSSEWKITTKPFYPYFSTFMR